MGSAPRPALSEVIPPLILGTATFNVQYHPDPSRMPYTDIVRRALESGVNAFDTSPYYGPSEILLGDALRQLEPAPNRADYLLITKCGRIRGDEFDYSPAWVRYSVHRSLERLGTSYLDLVYTHDVEFVSPEEVLAAVKELRSLRDKGLIRYVGISGYPVDQLASLAEMILRETGEPLDAVLSYSNYNIQNTLLARPDYQATFRRARIGCLLNASMLSMGLLKSRGIDSTQMSSWHPAPADLRAACAKLSDMTGEDTLESVALRWALSSWERHGEGFGTHVTAAVDPVHVYKRGISVMGVSSVEELDETVKLWKEATEKMSPKAREIALLVHDTLQPALGKHKDQTWISGGPGFVNQRPAEEMGKIPDDEVSRKYGLL